MSDGLWVSFDYFGGGTGIHSILPMIKGLDYWVGPGSRGNSLGWVMTEMAWFYSIGLGFVADCQFLGKATKYTTGF